MAKKVKKKGKKVIKKRVVIKKAAPKGPQYVCSTCGLKLVVTDEGAGVFQLMCCEKPLEKKE